MRNVNQMLTQYELNKISRLTLSEIVQIFRICEESLGLADMETASNVLGISKRRIYQLMNGNNSISIGRHKLPCINLIINK